MQWRYGASDSFSRLVVPSYMRETIGIPISFSMVLNSASLTRAGQQKSGLTWISRAIPGLCCRRLKIFRIFCAVLGEVAGGADQGIQIERGMLRFEVSEENHNRGGARS